MENFASLICSVTSDQSNDETSWYFPSNEDHSRDYAFHQFQQPEHVSSCPSDVPSYANDHFLADVTKDSYPSPHTARRFSRDSGNENDPFSLHCRIPVPNITPMSRYHMWLETSFMCRRNERERQRVRNVNDGFSRLRNHLPRMANMRRRQSKVDTLQHAIKYIKHLQNLLQEKTESDDNNNVS